MLKSSEQHFDVFNNFNRHALSGRVATGLLMGLEAIIVWLCGTLSCLFILHTSGHQHLPYQLLIMLASLSIVSLFYIFDVYDFTNLSDTMKTQKRIVNMMKFIAIVFSTILFSTFIQEIADTFSRKWMITWWMATMTALCIERYCTYRILNLLISKGYLSKPIVIFGINSYTGDFIDVIQNDARIKIAGLFDERLERSPKEVNGHKVAGNLETLIQYIRDNRCYEVYVFLPLEARSRIDQISSKLKLLPVPVRLLPCAAIHNYANHKVEIFSGIPTLEILNKPLADWDYLIKLAEDRLLGLFFCILLAPFYLIIAILIKLDSPGPILFKQKRYGYNNRLIEVYKFRSMYVSATDQNAAKLVTKGDPRVTKIGSFLRRTSLDEIPQFFNVLKGEMSIVGPRPHALSASADGKLYEVAVSGYAERHKVKPGVTGWAQVNGWRGETDTEEKILKRVEYDIDYIKNWSLFLDLFIIFKTVFVVFNQKNAY